MTWDEELEQLAGMALDRFSEEEINAAIGRVVAEVTRSLESPDLGRVIAQAAERSGAHVGVVPPGVMEAALKRELRRLLRVH